MEKTRKAEKFINEPGVDIVEVVALDGELFEQITTETWRMYKRVKDGRMFKSITHMIDSTWAKDPFLMNYIRMRGEIGKEEFEKAGDQGTRVHEAIHHLEKGGKINLEPYDKKERDALMAFKEFWSSTKPKFLWGETVVYSEKLGFAATIDAFCEIAEEPNSEGVEWVIDWKTSKSCYDTHKIQVEAQKMALEEMTGKKPMGGVVVLGNNTKSGWTLTALTSTDGNMLREIVEHLCRIYDLRFPEQRYIKQYPITLSLKEENKQ